MPLAPFPLGRAFFHEGAAALDIVFAVETGIHQFLEPRVVALVGSGAVRVPEIKLFSLSQAAAAHEQSEARHVRGKLVFKLP